MNSFLTKCPFCPDGWGWWWRHHLQNSWEGMQIAEAFHDDGCECDGMMFIEVTYLAWWWLFNTLEWQWCSERYWRYMWEHLNGGLHTSSNVLWFRSFLWVGTEFSVTSVMVRQSWGPHYHFIFGFRPFIEVIQCIWKRGLTTTGRWRWLVVCDGLGWQ